MKSILLPLTAHIQEHIVIDASISIASWLDATINGLFIRPDPRTSISFMGEGLTADMIQDLCEATESEGLDQAEKCEQTFNRAMMAADIDFESDTRGATARWRVAVGEITDHVGRKARTADLAICPQPSATQPGAQDILNDLIYRSGRPVLMVPETGIQRSLDHILVAWNGRAEGARAVGASLPFLKRAGKVTLLQLGVIDQDRPSLADVSEYLVDHGVRATMAAEADYEGSVGEGILKYAKTEDADLIVIGAYSHSRWREMILGGVTRHLVHNSPKPVFMSH
ncbi:MAG: universal stress protein [Kordiimonas sp.]